MSHITCRINVIIRSAKFRKQVFKEEPFKGTWKGAYCGGSRRGKTVRDQGLRGRGLTQEAMFSFPVEFESYLAGSAEPLKAPEAKEQLQCDKFLTVS